MPGFTFPTVGRLDNTSPPSRSAQQSDHRYYVPLRLPKVRLRFVRYSLSAPDTLFVHLVCVSRIPSNGFQTCSRELNYLLEHREYFIRYSWDLWLHKETVGSLKFPSYPFEYMPWSTTTVVSISLVMPQNGLLPSAFYKNVGVPSWLTGIRVYPMTTTISFSKLNTGPVFSIMSGLGLPLPGLPSDFSSDLLTSLCSRGIRTHWATKTNFLEFAHSFPDASDLTWHSIKTHVEICFLYAHLTPA